MLELIGVSHFLDLVLTVHKIDRKELNPLNCLPILPLMLEERRLPQVSFLVHGPSPTSNPFVLLTIFARNYQGEISLELIFIR